MKPLGGPLAPLGGAMQPQPRPNPQGGMPIPSADDAAADKGLQRTEFVILFIWKEPTDSDNLRGLTAGTSGGGNAAVGSGNSSAAPPKRFRRSRGGRSRQKGG